MKHTRAALWLVASGMLGVWMLVGELGCGGGPGPVGPGGQTPTTGPTGSVRGLVTNEDGTNVAGGADVALVSNPDIKTTTGLDGKFTLTGVPLNTTQQIAARRLGFGSGLSPTFRLTADSPDLQLAEPIRLTATGPPDFPEDLFPPIPPLTPTP